MKEIHTDMIVREISVSDAVEFKRLRLEGLTLYPEAFAEIAEDFNTKSYQQVSCEITDIYSSGGFLVGAFDNCNRLLGIVGFHKNSWSRLKHRGHIWGVYVDSEYQHRGIGKLLLKTVIEKSKVIPELVQLDISVVTTNKKAYDLYKRIGFKDYGIQRRALKVNNVYLDEYILAFDLYPENMGQ